MRTSPLADPEFAHDVAEAFVAGLTLQEVADLFGVRDKKTPMYWKRDPRVQTIIRKLIHDRVTEVCRKVDSVIAARLQNAHELTMKELLDVRKEFLGGQLRDQATEIDESTVNEAMDFFESNPTAAQQLRTLLSGGNVAAPAPTPET